MWGVGFGVLVLRVWGSGIWVLGPGCRVLGSGFRGSCTSPQRPFFFPLLVLLDYSRYKSSQTSEPRVER